jgi:hypothetical protein
MYFRRVRNNCLPFDRDRSRAGRRTQGSMPAITDEIFGHLSSAQYAFLSGVLAILSEHGEEALTKSCEMVIERFGRGRAS